MFYLTISYIHFDAASLREISYSSQTRVSRFHLLSLPSVETPMKPENKGLLSKNVQSSGPDEHTDSTDTSKYCFYD